MIKCERNFCGEIVEKRNIDEREVKKLMMIFPDPQPSFQLRNKWRKEVDSFFLEKKCAIVSPFQGTVKWENRVIPEN